MVPQDALGGLLANHFATELGWSLAARSVTMVMMMVSIIYDWRLRLAEKVGGRSGEHNTISNFQIALIASLTVVVCGIGGTPPNAYQSLVSGEAGWEMIFVALGSFIAECSGMYALLKLSFTNYNIKNDASVQDKVDEAV